MKYSLVILTLLSLTGCSSYVYRAYFHPDSMGGVTTSMGGYPTISPPDNFTGVWTDYRWDGKILAQTPYWNGKTHGTAFAFKDDGHPCLIRRYENGHYVEDYYSESTPQKRAFIPFWFPAKYFNASVVSTERKFAEQGDVPIPHQRTHLLCGCAKSPRARLGSASFVRDDSSSHIGTYRPPDGKIPEKVVLKESLGPFFEVQCAYGQGAKDPYSYLRVVLRAFRGGEKDLVEFFRWSYRDTRSASAGPTNAEFTRSLLEYWGDRRFAAVLTEQPLEVRRGVGGHLWNPACPPRLADKYPETAKAAMLKPCHSSAMRH